MLSTAVDVAHAVQLVGLPEARINLAQAVIAIATAPKSPGVIRGIDSALRAVQAGETGEVPKHLRDAHYPGAKALGHGQSYLFPHDFEHGVVQQYLPDRAVGAEYYQPTDNGFEATIGTRMRTIERLTSGDAPAGTTGLATPADAAAQRPGARQWPARQNRSAQRAVHEAGSAASGTDRSGPFDADYWGRVRAIRRQAAEHHAT